MKKSIVALTSVIAMTIVFLPGCSKPESGTKEKPAIKWDINLSHRDVSAGVSAKSQGDPSSVYMNGLEYTADRDPQTQEPTIQDFVIANFNSHNKVEWLNLTTRDTFVLFNIINATYDNNGNVVSGDLQWAKESVVLQ